jgi:hypothetical protein
MKITIAPNDGIDNYDQEMSVIYKALEQVMDEDFSGALITDESYITDFLTWGDKEKRAEELKQLEQILGLPMDNTNLVYLCNLIRKKPST